MWDKYIVPGSAGMQQGSLAGSSDGAATSDPSECPLEVETEALGWAVESWSAAVVDGPTHYTQKVLQEHLHMVLEGAWGADPAD
jgi:hypothetical protein